MLVHYIILVLGLASEFFVHININSDFFLNKNLNWWVLIQRINLTMHLQDFLSFDVIGIKYWIAFQVEITSDQNAAHIQNIKNGQKCLKVFNP